MKQIVIDISEDLYEGIERRDGSLETEYVCNELMKAIDNGIPLPKGHSRLFDERDIVNGDYEIIGNRIYELEPIIEADREGE